MSLLKKVRKDSIRKKILWTSPNGATVVVQGPFPEGFYRSLAYKTIQGAIVASELDISPRPATTKASYAKVNAFSVDESHNEWGEISP